MRKFTWLIVGCTFTFYSTECLAQFSTVWTAPFQHTVSPGYSNEGRRAAEDPSGNIFILADVTSDLDPSGIQGTSTYHYTSLAKYSTNGSLIFTRNIQVFNHASVGYDNLGAFGLEVDASGNVYVGYTIYDPVSGFDIALAKYDNNLSRIWTNVYATNANEEGVDFKLKASSGTLYAVVKSVGVQTTYKIIESVPQSIPPTLAYTFTANSVVINSLATDGNQIVYVAGYAIKGGYKNAYVAAVDIPSGSILWGSLYTTKGILGDDVFNEVTVGQDGNIYSVGTSYQGPAFGNEILVTKNFPGNPHFDFVRFFTGNSYNTKGLFVNATEIGWVYIGAASETDNYAYAFRIPDDGIFISPGIAMFKPVPSVAYDTINTISLTAMKVSSSKNIYLTGSISVSGPSGDFTCSYLYKSSVVFGNALIDAGGVAVDGQFDNNYGGASLTLDYAKTDVYWLRNSWNDNHQSEIVELIDVSVPSPLREKREISTSGTVTICQNQATGIVGFISDVRINSIDIMDASGKLVKSLNGESSRTEFNSSSLTPGIYICVVNTEAGRRVKKLFIN